MLEWMEAYGPRIIELIIALSGLGVSIYNITKIFKMGKKVDENVMNTQQSIQITQQGIIEAFKTAKIPTEWKIDVSNKIDSTLSAWKQDMLSEFSAKQAQTNAMLLLALTILDNTAASGKLTDEQRAQLNELVQQVNEDDKTVNLT